MSKGFLKWPQTVSKGFQSKDIQWISQRFQRVFTRVSNRVFKGLQQASLGFQRVSKGFKTDSKGFPKGLKGFFHKRFQRVLKGFQMVSKGFMRVS